MDINATPLKNIIMHLATATYAIAVRHIAYQIKRGADAAAALQKQ